MAISERFNTLVCGRSLVQSELLGSNHVGVWIFFVVVVSVVCCLV